MTNTTKETTPILNIASIFGISFIFTGVHFLFLYFSPITTYFSIFCASFIVALLPFFFYMSKGHSSPNTEIFIMLVFAINIGFGFFNINTNKEMERALSSKISNFEDYSVVIRFSDNQLKAGIEKHNKMIDDQQEFEKKAKEKQKIEAEKIRNL